MSRQIILDTETTGIGTKDGHRIIEIACVEMIDRKLTNQHFHRYINPEREIEAEAIKVHGITNARLINEPKFNEIADEFMAFVKGAELIIHNAPFDIEFIDYELMLARKPWKSVKDHCGVIDTLVMARKMHVGQRNSLDALCKRYFIDNSKRDLHGALLDCNLLAQVYLAMTGGQGNFFDTISENEKSNASETQKTSAQRLDAHQLVVLQATPDELVEHEKYLAMLQKKGKCVWM